MRCWVAALPDILRWAVNQSIQQKATCGNTLQQCNNATTFVSTCMVLLDATRNPFALRFNWSDPSSERLEDMLDVAWSCPYWNVPITFHFLPGISKTSLAIPFPCRLVQQISKISCQAAGWRPCLTSCGELSIKASNRKQFFDTEQRFLGCSVRLMQNLCCLCSDRGLFCTCRRTWLEPRCWGLDAWHCLGLGARRC